jgi:hypothetical protein
MNLRRRLLRRRGLELGKRLFLDRDDGDGVPGASRGVEHQEGKSSVAGDET